MRSTLPILSVIALIAVGASSTFAQSSKPARQYDWSTPLAASASLARAREDYDQAAVTSAYHAVSADERALLKALDEQGNVTAELHKASMDRFNRGLPTGQEAVLEEADVKGDEAIVYLGGKQSGLGIRWVRIDGEWKLPMDHVLRVHLMSYKSLKNSVDQKQAWTKVLRQVTDDVRAGRYASPEDVDAKLGDLATADDAASTQPASQ